MALKIYKRLTEEIIKRFWEKVDVGGDDECWPWQAQRLPMGYGQFHAGDKKVLAHRVAWVIEHGEIPDGMLVCHSCDVRFCTNPKHLFLGTAKDNTQDMFNKGRSDNFNRKGENHPRTKLTDDIVIGMRELYAEGNMTQKQVAERFGVHPKAADAIISGKNWSHLP